MKNKAKVWILDDEGLTHDKEFEVYREHNIEYKVTTKTNFDKDLEEFGVNTDAVVAQVGFPCDANLISRLENCKAVFTFGMGFNHVDLEAAAKKGIYVCNMPDYCVQEVSDHTIALSLTLLRKLFSYNKNVKEGIWNPTDTQPIYRLSNTVIGLFGFGQIAREVVKRFIPFGVKIIAHDKYVEEAIFEGYGVTSVDFDTLLQQSNLLSLHVPLTDETRNILNYEKMKSLPKGAIIVNTCRGGIIQEEDLVKLLKEKHLSGAGLDVLTIEPPNKENELLSIEETIITPHAAYFSIEAEEELQTRTAQNVVRVVNGEKPKHIVNNI
ncbi:C-terminal binding protein [Pseudogracilibacillus auburnensis]|uniref:D-3-phosphoglycerate dehydrogenase n=1 Tax=Pseudogracilibacillus auburnensis TaxID=1494959 RepID=A0A2V3VJ07_9BACI|nr:C-terminal binding protein [Pseudogracilibacillus auburnensis]PXW81697.1 D-3-phosphoglycerate dehydrogenase [Pseudogracilibacillus auburnensis]